MYPNGNIEMSHHVLLIRRETAKRGGRLSGSCPEKASLSKARSFICLMSLCPPLTWAVFNRDPLRSPYVEA